MASPMTPGAMLRSTQRSSYVPVVLHRRPLHCPFPLLLRELSRPRRLSRNGKLWRWRHSQTQLGSGSTQRLNKPESEGEGDDAGEADEEDD
ncbi:hypothetical protein CRV24_008685 [Beauveria bassiana]|nr:hypothetical protein CRV24_008685 [Beauveria bassiana]